MKRFRITWKVAGSCDCDVMAESMEDAMSRVSALAADTDFGELDVERMEVSKVEEMEWT